MEIQELLERRVARFTDRVADWDAFADARVEGFRVCGKTGTAEVTDVHGKLVDRTTWFTSFAPYEKPRYVIVLMVEGGAFGSTTCAPAVGKIYQAIQKLEQQRGLTIGSAAPEQRSG